MGSRRIFDIAIKDLTQLLRDRKTFLFTLIMPVIFTLLLGYTLGGMGDDGDSRLPLGWLDQDGSPVSRNLRDLLADSSVVRLVDDPLVSPDGLAARVANEALAGAVIVPPGYGHDLQNGKPAKLGLIVDAATSIGTTLENEVLGQIIHLESALRIAASLEDRTGAPFDYTYRQSLAAWQTPPVRVIEQTSALIPVEVNRAGAMAHTSPGMMLQFAIGGLLVSASIFVNERKNRCLARLLTTSARRVHILAGHYLSIFTLTLAQFTLLICFGQLLLRVAYLRAPLATGLVAISASLCVAALGVLVGVMAKDEEQAVAFAMIPMFVLSGLGGAWVPLDVVGGGFQIIGHFSPVAWAMDGFKNVVIRGLGVQSVLLPSAMLGLYALVFFSIAVWRARKF